MLTNGGFESNKPWITYDTTRRHWSDAHGPEHVASRAPQAYLDFLKRIENDEMMYGWENRVRLGSHGYHHTPSLFNPDPDHEFQHFDPEGDALRIERIYRDFRAMGLSQKSLRFWRMPGHKYTASLLNLLLDSGVVFFDLGETKFPADHLRLYTCYMLHKGNKRLCGINNSYWGDVATKDSGKDLFAALARGHLGHIGAHPEDLFAGATENNYNRFKSVITKCEKSYPNLGYVFPDEFADNAIAIYNLRVTSVLSRGSDVYMTLSGAVRGGNSAVFVGSCEQALFDGAVAQTRAQGPRTYIIFPEAAYGEHTLVLKNSQATLKQHNEEITIRMLKNVKFDINSRLLLLTANTPLMVKLEIVDLRGRLIFVAPPRLCTPDTPTTISFQNVQLTAGIYVFRLIADEHSMIFWQTAMQKK